MFRRPKFEIYKDAAGNYRWRLKDTNGEKIASSGESFVSRSNAERAARNVIDACKRDPEVE